MTFMNHEEDMGNAISYFASFNQMNFAFGRIPRRFLRNRDTFPAVCCPDVIDDPSSYMILIKRLV